MKRDPIVIHLDEAGLRLDKWLSIRLPEHSREFWKQRILKGEVTVNGKKVNPSRSLIENDQIEFSIEVEETKVTPAAEPLTLKLLYEDEWFFVVDKPAGLVVHPAHGHASGTLADALGAMYPKGLSDLSGKDRQGIVHRQKMRQELPILPPQRKITLVLPHGGDEHFLRQGQEFLFKITANHRGKFY